MIVDGIASKKIEDLFIDKYVDLIDSGVKSSQILVLLQNSNDRKNFIQKVLNKVKTPYLEKLNIHTFGSLVYNTVSDSWGYLENKSNNDVVLFEPNLVGLEVSQYLLKDILKEVEVKGYNSKKSLLHQIFRRYSLIVQNNLSKEDVRWRSKLLKESFADDAELIIDKLMSKTYHARSYDYIRQMHIFNHIYQNTDYFNNVKYLFVKDADEMTPIVLDFIEYLFPKLKDYFIQFDELGSSRCGYLGADMSVKTRFETLMKTKADKISESVNPNVDKIYRNVAFDEKNLMDNFSLVSPSKRPQMIELAINDIIKLLKSGVSPNDISVITPNIDEMLKFCFNEKLKIADVLFLSGSEKLIQIPLIRATVSILKLAYDILIDELELRVVLNNFFKIPLKSCYDVLNCYVNENKLALENNTCYDLEFQAFKTLLEELKTNKSSLSEKLCTIFKFIPKDVSKNEIVKYNFLVKQIRDFEMVFSVINNGEKVSDEEVLLILNQLENSIVSENPNVGFNLSKNEIIVSTPQKLIDYKIETKYQFWLDVSSSDWMKNDTGPLYNAWVFQAGWDKNEYTVEDSIFLSKDKVARCLRKLLILNKGEVFAYSSLFDSSGCENYGGIEKYILLKEDKSLRNETNIKEFIPRDDQVEVLNYKRGEMAISAVPGAGKTTVLLELLLKLLDNGVNPENIFVLTYMESAARNFRDRIKNRRKNDIRLPNISTIHGLALRIIKENSNYEKLGLPSDFDICDDSIRIRIIKSISKKYKKSEVDEFEKNISVFKLSRGEIPKNINNPKLVNFFEFYNSYQEKLKELSLLDYDDILVLSVKLLTQNEDVRNYYSNICQYVIEDEAQDSSSVQQELLTLLSSKHKNLIRCGDINQAITASFTNSDLDGFKKFIKKSEINLTMNRSQRCSKGVFELANSFVDFGNGIIKESFYDVKMLPVEGKNPVSKNAVTSIVFNNDFAEKNYILKTIRDILSKDPNASIAILLRSNYRVGSWANFIANAGLKCITRSECLEQKLVYRLIFAILDFIKSPFDNSKVENLYNSFCEYGFLDQGHSSYFKNLSIPFLQNDVDELKITELSKFYWELDYWTNLSYLTPDQIVLKISELYFKSEVEKANAFLIAIIVKRLNMQGGTLGYVVDNLSELAKRANLSGFKFFNEDDDNEVSHGAIQIMTMHKSKGDEFDYVFIPELKEKMFPMNPSNYELKKDSDFSEKIKALSKNYKVKNPTELKEFLISEGMRLLYVAITRAKKKLYFTVSNAENKGKNNAKKAESVLFETVLG